MKYSYLKAGVDVKKADRLTQMIKNIVKEPQIGPFAGVFEHSVFEDYYFVSCSDGVGTKIIPLIDKKDTHTLANDLVAMNLNDLICTGAKPMFFLDYIAANKLDVNLAAAFLSDLNKNLVRYDCVLLGGETSELGDLILKKYFDVCGFLVGAVKKDKFIDKNNTKKGDVIIGLKSNGAHSNGFTLLRKLYADKMISDELFEQSLAPVKIYYEIVQQLNEKKLIKSAANITGGGILANLRRAVNEKLDIEVDFDKIPKMLLFEKIVEIIGSHEAYQTFNMGAGFCVVVSKDDVDMVLKIASDWEPFVFGEVV